MSSSVTGPTLDDHQAPSDPMELFDDWLKDAVDTGMFVPNAMALATVREDGTPAVRMVLLKGHGPDGFVFYTNYESAKSEQLDATGQATLLFWWRDVQRQVRVRGTVCRTDAATSAAYFASRDRGSQLGAWASHQSHPVGSRQELDARFRDTAARFEGSESVPCPPFWGGYRLEADSMEFWQGRDDRMHDRVLYRRAASGGWSRVRLMP